MRKAPGNRGLEFDMTKEELELERAKRGCEMFVELSKAQIQFSAKALQGLLIINGGAATAVLAARIQELEASIGFFSFGALFSVLGFAFGYFANSCIGDTWRIYMEDVDNWKEYHGRKQRWSNFWIVLTVLAALASACLFAWPVCQYLIRHAQQIGQLVQL